MTQATDSTPTIIRRPRVQALTGLSRSTIYERIGAGTFPPQVSLGARAVGWVETEVFEWLRERVAESRKAGA